MKFNHVLNNFTSGEWSPKMIARTDTEQYKKSALEILNGFVRPQGGVFRRPGFELKDSLSIDLSEDHIIIPYYVIGKRVAIIATATEWKAIDVDTWTTISLGKGPDVDLPSVPEDIRHIQIGDTLFIASKNNRPLHVRYTTGIGSGIVVQNYDSYFNPFNMQPDEQWRGLPYGQINADGIGGTLTVTGTLTKGGTVSLASSTGFFRAEHAEGTLGQKNLVIKITSAGNTAAIKVTTVTDPFNAAGVMMSAKTGTSPLVVGSATGTAYELSDWNGFDGWPTTVTAIQNRLVFARGYKLYFTRSGNYYDMMEIPFQQSTQYAQYASDGSRPFTAAPFSTDLVNILELTSAKTLIILSENSEIVGYGGNNGISALPGGFIVESSTSFGTKRVPPVRVNSFVTFAQAIGSAVRDLTFNWEQSQYKSMDLSFPAEHLFRSSDIKTMTTSEMDGSHLWVINEDGTLNQCVLDRDYSINAWSKMRIDGYKFVSIVTIKSRGIYTKDFFIATVEDEDGNRSIVKLADFYEQTNEVKTSGPFPEYMDLFSRIGHGSPTKTISGLSFYEDKEVQVLADGFYLGKFVVSGGEVTVPLEHTNALVGLPAKFRLESMPVEAGAQLGDSTGKKKRIDTAFIRFWNTLGGTYGCPQTGEFYPIQFRDDTEPMNLPPKLKDLEISVSIPSGYSKIATIAIESDDPFPCNVLGIGIEGITHE